MSSEQRSGSLSATEFVEFITERLDLPDGRLIGHQPIFGQLELDSAVMIELVILLEEELGIDLHDDVDLYGVTLAQIHGWYLSQR